MDAFAVQRQVEALAFVFFVDAQADHQVDDLEDRRRGDGAPKDGEEDALALNPQLAGISFQHAGGAADGLDRENPGQQRADDAADAVDAEAVRESS